MEILPGDLLCGARFNMMYSMCLTEAQQKERDKLVLEARKSMLWLFDHGYGNSGATSGQGRIRISGGALQKAAAER